MRESNWCDCPRKLFKPSMIPPNCYCHFIATSGNSQKYSVGSWRNASKHREKEYLRIFGRSVNSSIHSSIHLFNSIYWTFTVCQALCSMLNIFQWIRQIWPLLYLYLDSDGIVTVFIEAMSIDDPSKGVEKCLTTGLTYIIEYKRKTSKGNRKRGSI